MSEGIAILSSDGIILSANKSAKNLLPIESGQLYTSLKDSNDVIDILKKALGGKKTIEKISREGKIYQLTATPVTNLYGEYSVVMLILDITSAEQSESMRREFSANVSHELKTPLTTILGYAEIISNGLAKSGDIPTFANQIHAEASRLLTLIEDIIKLSRLDEKELVSEFERVDLYEICSAVIERLSVKAQKLDISLTLDGTHMYINGVRSIISEIIFNLTDNAITYNKAGGSVKLSLDLRAGRTVCSVADTGIGIPKEDKARIFERFYRVDKSHSKETGGTGLGLSIVKHGAMLHNADITLDSELGKGTTVTVSF
jgi:two-component system phosphate regulon sensor histidine kinase PhoR